LKYRIYIDEVGNPDLGNTDNFNHRFLSLTGVILELGYVEKTLHPQMEALKKEFFDTHPDEPVFLHRKEIVNAKPPFQNLRKDETRQRFDIKLLTLLNDWDYKVITVCIDKKSHLETYSVWRYDPYHYCMEVLLERYIFFLDRASSCGDVMAESRGGKEDMRLKRTFSRLYQKGTNYIPPERFSQRLTSCQLKVKNKANNIAGLQLADLIAHPSRNEILKENGHCNKPLAIFGKKIKKILKDKYYQLNNQIYGKKMI